MACSSNHTCNYPAGLCLRDEAAPAGVGATCLCATGFVWDNLAGWYGGCFTRSGIRFQIAMAIGIISSIGMVINLVALLRSTRLLKRVALLGFLMALFNAALGLALGLEGEADGRSIADDVPKYASSLFQTITSALCVGVALSLFMSFSFGVSKSREIANARTCFVAQVVMILALHATGITQLVFLGMNDRDGYNIAVGAQYLVITAFCLWNAFFVSVEIDYMVRTLDFRLAQILRAEANQTNKEASKRAMKSLKLAKAFIITSCGAAVVCSIFALVTSAVLGGVNLMETLRPETQMAETRLGFYVLYYVCTGICSILVGAFTLFMTDQVGVSVNQARASNSGGGGSSVVVATEELRGIFRNPPDSWGSIRLFELLGDATALSGFVTHLEQEYADESLEFLKAVMQWKKVHADATETTRAATGRKIVSRFVDSQSPEAVNISDEMRTQILELVAEKPIKAFTLGVFDPVAREVSHLLEHGPMARYAEQQELLQEIMSYDVPASPRLERAPSGKIVSILSSPLL